MLEVLDTAGQEEYTGLREQWIRDGEAFLLVYSISSRSSFSRIQRFHNQVLRVKESPISSAPPICLLVGNKSDRCTEREVSTQEGHALANELDCEFVESSAKNCINIEKAFYDLVRQIRRQRSGVNRSTPTNRFYMGDTRRTYRRDRSQKKDMRTGYAVKRRWWGDKISIPPNEGKSEDGRKRLTTALIIAAKSNLERELIAFLEAGANPDGQPGSDGAAIHAASASGHANIVNILLKKGTAINAKGPSGTSPLQIAAAEGHLTVVRLLLHKGAQIDQTSQLHGTALSAAASRGRLEVVRFLLKKQADVNVVGGSYGNALQAAAWVGSSAIVEALLGAGADINARGDGDCTALQIAAFAGHANVIRSLLDLGGKFNIDAPGGKYGCALKAADDQGHFEAVTILLRAGASSTLNIPAELPISTSVGHIEAEQTPESGDPVEGSIATPGASSDQPISAPSPVLISPTVPRHIRTSSVPQLGGPAEKPIIHAIGFSSLASPVNAIVE